MAGIAQRDRLPWPGPVPYDEAFEDVFFGRGDDINKLCQKLQFGRLSVLSARSGVGKTSLLRAGLVPEIRRRRSRGFDFGPVLVLSEWGLLARSPVRALFQAIQKEISAIASSRNGDAKAISRLSEDAASLLSVPLPTFGGDDLAQEDLVDYIRRLAESTNGLVLIIDQAEELLGSSLGIRDGAREREVVNLIAHIYDDVDTINILIALRQEHLASLQLLGGLVGGVEQRTHHLDPLASSIVQSAVLEATLKRSESVSVDRQALGDFLNWLAMAEGNEAHSNIDGLSVDLVAMQAALLGLVDESGPGGHVTREVVDRYRRRIDQRLRSVEDKTRNPRPNLVLQEYVDGLCRREVIAGVLGTEWQEQAALMRRILARIAPWLSSGGFKQSVPQGYLLARALGHDLGRCGVVATNDVLAQELGTYDGTRAPLFLSSIAEPENDDEEETNAETPSPAKGLLLRPKEAAELLCKAGLALLDHLRDRQVYVLKGGFGSTSDRTCELVHDGLGPALVRWAEREVGTFEDVYASVAPVAGDDFRWTEVPSQHSVVSNVTWLSVRLGSTAFSDVVFRDCDLRGVLFDRCTFNGCTFENCDLSGAMFRGGAVAGGAEPGLLLLDGKAHSAMFKKVTVGHVRIERTELQFSQFVDFVQNEDGKVAFVECDLRNARVANMDEDWVVFQPPQQSRKRLGLIRDLERLRS